ncbi:type IV pilus biogenesis/stability protein PilW [Celerinatantimonas yamalensis]|uniref:Type IV pilus biogenesis/stability protein PilW n=1 Tax=Celerinatantimonas yamalensis TaxID=559956 RepID=A0ABW9GCY7_9GAMM
MLKRWAWIFLLPWLVSGCVTQKLVDGVPVDQNQQQPKNKKQAARSRLALAINYLHSGDSELAKRNIDLAAKDAPNLIDVDLTWGYFYSAIAQTDKAIAAYQRALRKDPNNGDALNNLGVIRCHQGHYQQAEKMFQQAINAPQYTAIDSTNENAGLCAYHAGEYDKAKSYFLAALAYNARRPESLLGLTNVLIKQHQYADARSYLTRYGNIAPTSAASLLAWIRITRGEGNIMQQVLWGRQLITQYPDSPQTKKYLANDY